ncbi:DEP domain and Winged helix-turn-helix DNA-binding domain-containing protein [Strongyloides ratti]|uniref:DEP domain and Winged helix-turn-helix DNA-binding domain-containing protein n=1 Tax=Strongyloides ratti TaxID=34506 RepID=A0A090L1U1_STRRB|nr:DEP domain and Winged helix-turn-helix DNA-binding domain-containing protein [Strongyloides ratti]CEF63662.1 DEP domain and Winged helix-turn-helix DNA-binding domain-containing protein [Strongyloides ratti]
MKTFFSVRTSLRNSVRNSFKRKITKTTSLESKKSVDSMISQEDINNLQCGQFKAIRKFSIILNLFKDGIPKKTYKTMFKKYENVFSGKDAIDFLSNDILPIIEPTGINFKIKATKLIIYFLKEKFLICLSTNIGINTYTFSDTDIYCINENYTIPKMSLENKYD